MDEIPMICLYIALTILSPPEGKDGEIKVAARWVSAPCDAPYQTKVPSQSSDRMVRVLVFEE